MFIYMCTIYMCTIIRNEQANLDGEMFEFEAMLITRINILGGIWEEISPLCKGNTAKMQDQRNTSYHSHLPLLCN